MDTYSSERFSPVSSSYAADPFDSGVDIKEYLYLLWSWAWVIILAGLVAGAAAYFISSRQVPMYETTTRLLVSDPPSISTIDSKSMLNTSTMPTTYSEMVLDSPVLQGVIDDQNLTLTVEQLKKNISVELINQTQLLVVTVTDPDPVRAADMANSLARVFADRVRELQSQRYTTSKDGLQKQVTEMGTQIEKTTRELEITTNEASRQQLEARLTEYTKLYSDLVLNYEKVRLSEAQTSTNVVVTEPATPNYTPVSPRTMQNTFLAVVVGMLLAAGTIFAVDMLDDSIKNPEEVRKSFNIPILGVIARHEVTDGKPVCEAEPRSPVAESFRALRTNINFASVDRPLRKIVITSPTPQDGKTTISTNLAVVVAQGEKTVVLVDADLRRPQVHHRFGLMNRLGLSDLFVKPDDAITDALQRTTSPRLAVMTSGSLPPNPSELLTSQRMGKIMEILLHGFDMIVIDTPPVLTVTDAAAMAQSVDGVILVAKPGSTKKSAFRQSLEALQAVNATILGVVLNEVNPSSKRYGYYYNKYYAKGKYYYDGEGKKKG
ncbi:polysaccharide biosynthesis tyrosine autokinase [Leptolinea tardivitalis]|uniref:polysaccharide biosynthesis tyrosine autokinase n=1 Tax=Leptolinea tardivitalis TaxID=229920 RepID=UPI000783685F|nr:polysaccharide biosynthesis tyrosine autokinase [Leptolinea tardivitalis]GAP23076.1 capsular exopolysaccharide family [Leptolinea tardivitalis]